MSLLPLSLSFDPPVHVMLAHGYHVREPHCRRWPIRTDHQLDNDTPLQ